MSPLTRRRLLASAGVGAAGLGLGAAGYALGQESEEAAAGTGSVPFHDAHQAGIDTPAQDRLHFAAFDLLSEDPAQLCELMRAQRGGHPVIPADSHVRHASARENDGARILRRGYSFTDGVDESLGELEAGLFFICFQRDPARQLVPIQRRLGQVDALNEYIEHVGSAVFAVPPGARPGGYVGEGLLS